METLFALWLMGTIITAIAGATLWFFSHIDPELFSAKWGARCVLFCWAWPFLLLPIIPAVVRDALGREGRR